MNTFRLLCFLLPVAALAQELGKDWEIVKIAGETEIMPAAAVEVYNEYGDVRARSAPDQIFAYSAMIQKYSADAKTFDFQVEHQADKLVLRVVYPGGDADTVKGAGKRRADVTVFVPKNSRYQVRTEKGFIEAKGIHGDVDLASKVGKIFVRSEGHVTASTGQGDITAYLLNTRWTKPFLFETQIGAISVHLPKDASITVQAETAGELSTDYSIEIKRDEISRVKFGTAKIGAGKHRLNLKSKQGAIKINQGLWDVKSDPEQKN